MEMSGFQYRTFYTWDHSTNWDLSQPGVRVSGCHEDYDKPAEAFLGDYTRLIDFMTELGLNHLIIWGALRDAHGGAPHLKQIVEYGRKNGVRVAPGAGVNCYGGVYYEGESVYSLARFLQDRPDLAAIDSNGSRMIDPSNPRKSVACPRKTEVIEWNLRSMKWLLEEIGPDAIHYETGDYGVCHCPECREAGKRETPASDADMALVLPPLMREVLRIRPDCWQTYNHYMGFTRAMMADPPAFARAIPPEAICKWGVSWMLEPEIQKRSPGRWEPAEALSPEVKPPTARNMAHVHFGTGWWNCSPRGTLEITKFFRDVPRIRAVGFQGLCTHGEDSRWVPASELNYHVFAALAEDAGSSPEGIARRSVGRLLGDADLAAEVLTAFQLQAVPRRLPSQVAAAAEKARDEKKVRLTWLVFELHRLDDRVRFP